MAPAPEARKSGLDWKHPGGKEALIAGGVALTLALLYFWWKNRQTAQPQAAANAAGTASPTALFASFIHDFQSSSSGNGTGVQVTVPTVVGMSDTAADAAIGSAGLKVKDANERAGGAGGSTKVVSQSPDGGSKVKPGSTVTITLAAPAKKGSGGDSGEG